MEMHGIGAENKPLWKRQCEEKVEKHTREHESPKRKIDGQCLCTNPTHPHMGSGRRHTEIRKEHNYKKQRAVYKYIAIPKSNHPDIHT